MVLEEADFPKPPQKDSLHRAPFLDKSAFFVQKLSFFLGAGGIENDFFVGVCGAEIDDRVDEPRPDAAATMRRVYEPD